MNRGVSLLELIIYIAVLSIVALVTVNIFFVTMRSRDLINARYEIAQNLRFATEQIRQEVFDATSVSTSGSCPLNVLDITAGSATSSFYITNGVLQFSNASGTGAITNNNVIASTTASCLFAIIDNPPPAKDSLQVKLEMVYNSQGRSDLEISDERQMTITLR